MREGYSKKDSIKLDEQLNHTDARRPDLTDAPLEAQKKALSSLVAVLESGMKIIEGFHYSNPSRPEPFEGACGVVVKQCLTAVRLARNSGLIP